MTERLNWWGLAAKSCPLFCDPVDCNPPGSSVHGITQARILEWVAISLSSVSSQPRDQTCVSCVGRQVLYHLSHHGSLQTSYKGKKELINPVAHSNTKTWVTIQFWKTWNLWKTTVIYTSKFSFLFLNLAFYLMERSQPLVKHVHAFIS